MLCLTPTSGWLNLSHARQIRFSRVDQRLVCYITWSNGDKQTFYGRDAAAIAQALRYFIIHHRDL